MATNNAEEDMELSGKILKALKSFQRIFMDMKESDISLGYLSPMECSRILTIDAGTMLAQIPAKNGKPYLNPQEFNKMNKDKKIKVTDKSSIIYKAFMEFFKEHISRAGTEDTSTFIIIAKHPVEFLTNENPLEVKKEDTAASFIISKYDIVRMHWGRLKRAHLLR